jgi:endoglucanase
MKIKTIPRKTMKSRLLAIGSILTIAGVGAYFIVSSHAAPNPLLGTTFYINQTLSPVVNYRQLQTSNPAQAAEIAKIATYPLATWVGGWVGDQRAYTNNIVTAATARGEVPIIVTYNIPSRDCGLYSAGGASSHTAYRTWVDGVVAGIGMRRAIVIIEPDALPGYDCLDAAGRQARMDSVKYSVDRLRATTRANIYIDAGTSAWVGAADMATRLQQAGIANADGFSLNVSNFQSNANSITYGTDLSNRVGGKHFVIDSSRNGLGSNGEWCNPSGRALGTPPTTATGLELVDAYLWIKTIGESDGTCNGGPAAGTWWLDYALGLAQRSNVKPYVAPTTPPPLPPAPVTVGTGMHNDSVFTYAGTWSVGDNAVAGSNKYMADDHYSTTTDSTYSLTFNATQAKIYATKAPYHGIAAVRIDGGAEVIVDMYATTRGDQQLVYTSPVLTSGTHTVRVRVPNTKNAASTGFTINADRIEILNAPIANGTGDINTDSRVNALDLSILMAHDRQNYPPADLNHDNTVGSADLAILLSKWTW